MDIANSEKMELRKRFRSERSLRDRAESWTHIQNSSEFEAAKTIASYISYGDEPQTKDLNQVLIKSGKELALPRMLKDKSLEWVIWNGDSSTLEKNGKILEPIGEAIAPDRIDIVIVPTLHATRDGHRLGQGGGSYDRALAQLSAWRMGLIYSGELTIEPFPVEPHDMKLNAIATPDLIVRFTN
ncbi:COG0212 5-formyltetrahydrofolate cyclo-ligase [actinobacterium SCGC AAA044-D11]